MRPNSARDGYSATPTASDCWLDGHGLDAVVGLLADARARFDPSFRWARANGEWTLGTQGQGPMATLRAFDRFTLAGVADRIEADVLILAGAHDHLIPVSQVARFEQALTHARSVTTHVYEQSSGGAEHCQMGAVTLWQQDLFDWLAAKFPGGSAAPMSADSAAG